MSSATAIDYSYRYAFLSDVVAADDGKRLRLATSLLNERYPYFFDGRILQPRLFAQQLSALAKVVSTRYYMPPALLQRILAQRDPVVTSGGGVLRFEGFSACCSAYVRVDVSPNAYAGEMVANGTTNVDFNAPMRAALAQVRDSDQLGLAVGADEVVLRRDSGAVIERKVELPLRWLKGFVEVQAYQARMEHRFTLNRTETVKFLRSLPRSVNARSAFVVVPAGPGVRLSQARAHDGVELSGINRLLLLSDFAPFADELKIYTTPDGQASEWRLRCRDLTITIALSADVSRGFSGEGQVLQNLAPLDDEQLARARVELKWQSIVPLESLCREMELDETRMRGLLAALGSRGLVGYDCEARAYFHRELPFDYAAVDSLHPRLVQARKLAAQGGVRITARAEQMVDAEVAGTDVTHHVTIGGDTWRCTCQWFAKYQGGRGPCKHVLAARLVLDGEEE